jgi:c-di-GMP phosphodiesterase
MKTTYANIRVRKENTARAIKITSEYKPKITDPIMKKWQSLLDITAEVMNIPAALIMKLNEKNIEVFAKSQGHNNPYGSHEKAGLTHGLYCETVIGTQKKLLVPDATKDPLWRDDNPDIELNMISYLGYPINWPDGEVFGTICVLDEKENHYSRTYEKLLAKMKDHIETDLLFLTTEQNLEQKTEQLTQANEIKTRFLSLISHDIRGAVGSADEFLKLIVQRIDRYSRKELQTILGALSKSLTNSHQTLESLLVWSRQDLLNLDPVKDICNLKDIMEKVLKQIDHNLLFKKIELIRDYPEETPVVKADRNMIEVSFRNLLTNAVNYTPLNGVIRVKIFYQKGKWVAEIIDSGTGMDEIMLNELFSYSSEKHADAGTEKNGGGIGLIITRDFLDKNNASICYDSKPGKGTRVKITFNT